MHSFNGADGAKPNGNLVISGNTLYGMTPFGGNYFTGIRRGNVFKINTDGTGFQSIYNDLNGSSNYTWSYGSLVVIGNILFGKSNVNLYSLNTDGTGYQWYNWAQYGSIPESFDAQENGTLIFADGALFGVNNRCGGAYGNGVIYKFVPDALTNNTFDKLQSVLVYPNPTSSQINIDFNNFENEREIKIFNSIGQQVYTKKITAIQNIIELGKQNKGLYFIKVYDSSNKVIQIKKIIIK